MASDMTRCGSPLYISGQRVKELLGMKDVLEVVEKGLIAFSAGADGGVIQPVRSVIPIRDHSGFLGIMPCYCQPSNSLATKLVTFYSGNEEKGLPSHQALVTLFDPSTGTLLALVDGESVTEMRTAAASAVALKYMQPSHPRVLLIVGTGVQARAHAQALQLICQFEEIRVWGRSASKAKCCAADIGGSKASAWEDLPSACRDADVVVTVTLSVSAVVKGAWLKEGAVVIGVGACRPDWQELDSDLMQNAVVVVDSRASASVEAGDIILSNASVFCEVGELASGHVSPITREKILSMGKKFAVFKSLGLAVEDAVTAKLVYDKHVASSS